MQIIYMTLWIIEFYRYRNMYIYIPFLEYKVELLEFKQYIIWTYS